jgi:hypothetical protein
MSVGFKHKFAKNGGDGQDKHEEPCKDRLALSEISNFTGLIEWQSI